MGAPQAPDPPKARKLEAPKAEAPLVSIRATSADLGLDYALTIPVTEQRVENFSLLLFDLASAINAGQVLDMQQEVGMKTFEARLSRNLWNREAQQKFYTELGKIYEQQAIKMHEMRLSYYRELDHLRDQLGSKARSRTFTMMEDVHFFNPEAYRIPAWREVAELLEVDRRPAGPNEKHVRYVPVHVLCKACRAKFTDGVVIEPKDMETQVSEATLAEECLCCAGENGVPEAPLLHSGISRWAQTEISMAQDADIGHPAEQPPEPAETAWGAAQQEPAEPAPPDTADTGGGEGTGDEQELSSSLPDVEAAPLDETSLEASTTAAESPCPSRRHSKCRASLNNQEAFDLAFDDLDSEPDLEAPPPLPRRRRRSEPGAWREPGRIALVEVPDVLISTDNSGSDAEGSLERAVRAEVSLGSCPEASLGHAGTTEDQSTDSETESLGLPLTLEEGLRDGSAEYSESLASASAAMRASAEGTESMEGLTCSCSSVLATSQIEIKLGDGPAAQVPSPEDAAAAPAFPWEVRENATKQPSSLRSPRRRPTLESSAPEPRRDSKTMPTAMLPREPARARRNSSKEARVAEVAKDAEGSCASCPLTGAWQGRGEQQIRIRSFNFEVSDSTSSAALDDARRPSPRTFLPRVQLQKAKEPETKAFADIVERSVAATPDVPRRPSLGSPGQDRSPSPAGSPDRCLSPCTAPSSFSVPSRPAGGPQSARHRQKRTSLNVPCSRTPITSMSLISGGDSVESPRAPQHRGTSTSLDPCASGPVASPGARDGLPLGAAAAAVPTAGRQRFPSLLTAAPTTATTTRSKTEQSEL